MVNEMDLPPSVPNAIYHVALSSVIFLQISFVYSARLAKLFASGFVGGWAFGKKTAINVRTCLGGEEGFEEALQYATKQLSLLTNSD